MKVNPLLISLIALSLGACAAGDQFRGGVDALREPEVIQGAGQRPPGASPGTCWGKAVSPAVVETVTEQILLQPAEVTTDGRVLQPAIYKTETVQRIVKERRETWFEAPCQAQLTSEFISSVQRALAVRSIYRGRITGIMDSRTRAAIRRYQEPQGLNSGILALETARQLGLIAVARDAE
ncbi:peptidoglycan-binding domain-containing protein [Cognatishimia maritima]|uniref:Putative peptidoglycan binding domain-containing protein n=1 Tax=Cognatishimia maritima TaxID=870908 RepID=A0A1M5KT37_9RHOB|nr:peptidoglycan-binding domain-containing protein [Cognatishimia maritima]SHG55927.1 Putative peptidoglycan binding domain-containing protein [Cognatishimia maritima]